MEPFNLTPNPRVLVVLTHTAMKPIDALCELVDNAIDSFRSGAEQGENEVHVELPTRGDLRDGNGYFLRVWDNGPGMTPEAAKKALTAGYSSQGPFGSLGLFGVGLNIATGKFGRKTRLITATKDSDTALVVNLDLDTLIQQGNFQVSPAEEPKQNHFPGGSGTIIQIGGRWPEGNANHDFPKKLIQNGPGRVTEAFGRRYAVLLRGDVPPPTKIFVGGRKCEPFEHCVWGAQRSVLHSGRNRIFAQQKFDHLICARDRCIQCGALVENGSCVADDNHHGSERIEEKVHGWIGVQRYDDSSHYGIDLVRKGRTIRILEKAAFFTFKDELGREISDYPIDAPYGRIVGEVHLDHVPVNFTKEDFDRATSEWQDAIAFLRGKSSLQARQPGATENNSPLMKIYTGYRRVRKPGIPDLYMAQVQDGKIQRVSRQTEKEFLKRFNDREQGYYDDEKWFELVNVSEPDTYQNCPECGGQNLPSADECVLCGELLHSKECVECGEKIARSADSCKHCGKSQVPEGPWTCRVCGDRGNDADSNKCRGCDAPKGEVDPFDIEILRGESSEDTLLSVRDLEIDLPNGAKSTKFNLEVRAASLRKMNRHLPMILLPRKQDRALTIFWDKTHPLFALLRMPVQYAIAIAVADFIYADTVSVAQGARQHEHNLVILVYQVVEKYWKSALADDPRQAHEDVRALLSDIQEKMAENFQDIAIDIFGSLSPNESAGMVKSMQEEGVDIGNMENLRGSGAFMRYISPSAVVDLFRDYTSRFFDGRVWDEHWNIPEVPEEASKANQRVLRQTYLNCLEDCVIFLRHRQPTSVAVRRVQLSVDFLKRKLTR